MRAYKGINPNSISDFATRHALQSADEFLWELGSVVAKLQKGETPSGGSTSVPGGVTDHGALSGLLDDDHTQYALLAGRSGGQLLKGGTGASDVLTIYANAADGATGTQVKVGGTNWLLVQRNSANVLQLTNFPSTTTPYLILGTPGGSNNYIEMVGSTSSPYISGGLNGIRVELDTFKVSVTSVSPPTRQYVFESVPYNTGWTDNRASYHIGIAQAGGPSVYDSATIGDFNTAIAMTRLGISSTGTVISNIGPDTQVIPSAILHVINGSGTSNIPLKVQAVSSQAVDIQQWTDSGGTALSKVTKDGYVSTKQLLLNGSTSGTLTHIPAASTTSHSLTWPSAQGAANTFLKNDGSGGLSWAATTGSLTDHQHTATGDGGDTLRPSYYHQVVPSSPSAEPFQIGDTGNVAPGTYPVVGWVWGLRSIDGVGNPWLGAGRTTGDIGIGAGSATYHWLRTPKVTELGVVGDTSVLRLNSAVSGIFNIYAQGAGGNFIFPNLGLGTAKYIAVSDILPASGDPPGSGQAAIINRTGQTANISSAAQLTNGLPAGFYVLYCYVECTTAGSGTIVLSMSYADDAGTVTDRSIVTCGMAATTSKGTIAAVVYLASGDITFKTSGYVSGTYAVRIRVSYLGA